jgi:anthranilate synthase component 1
MADFETPVSAYAKLRSHGPAYLLESVEGGERLSRYSFIGCRPRKIFACGQARTEIREPGQPTRTLPTPADPLTLIEAELRQFRPVKLPGLPRFTGGAVGFLSYEYVTRIEPTVPLAPRDELGTPLIYFMLSDSLLIFDRAKQTLRLCVNAHVGGSAPGRRPPSSRSFSRSCASPARWPPRHSSARPASRCPRGTSPGRSMSGWSRA